MKDRESRHEMLTKVPAITLGFWIIKILATTLGETGGDTVTMTWLGETTAHPVPQRLSDRHRDFSACLIVLVWRKSRRAASIPGSTGRRSSLRPPADDARRLLPTARSASAIPADRSAFRLCARSLFAWHRTLGTRRRQPFAARAPRSSTGSRSPFRRLSARRWATGLPTPGWLFGGALVFGAGLAILATPLFRDHVSRVFLFWAAFILTRPLGATVGDFLDKPVAKGGLAMSRPLATRRWRSDHRPDPVDSAAAGGAPESGRSGLHPREIASGAARRRCADACRGLPAAGPPYETDDPNRPSLAIGRSTARAVDGRRSDLDGASRFRPQFWRRRRAPQLTATVPLLRGLSRRRLARRQWRSRSSARNTGL